MTITRELQSLQVNKQALEQRLTELNLTKADLQKDIDRLTELTANLRKGIVTVREGTIVLRAGEVIAVGVIQGGGTPVEVERRLAEYMQAANQGLRDRFQIKDDKLDLVFLPTIHVEEVVRFLAARSDSIVLRLLSVGNVVVGEAVVGQFEVFPNRQVFSPGEVVLSDKIEFSGVAGTAEQLIAVYLRRVNEVAVQRGVIPDPLQGTVGAVSMEQYFEAVNQLRRQKGTVELSAITTEPIYSVGPLRIMIQVRPVASSLINSL